MMDNFPAGSLGDSLQKLSIDSAKVQLHDAFVKANGPMTTWNKMIIGLYERTWNELSERENKAEED